MEDEVTVAPLSTSLLGHSLRLGADYGTRADDCAVPDYRPFKDHCLRFDVRLRLQYRPAHLSTLAHVAVAPDYGTVHVARLSTITESRTTEVRG